MGREKILVIEDEENIQELMRYNLAKEGFDVELASSGEDGVKKSQGAAPDLVLLDLMLPGVSGLEVCRVIKGSSLTRKIPVIIVSARGEESDIVKGLELGADDYVTK
ncbi:MAG TPA: response regulator, partial [Oligoflexia bacterium]|nr:response regulator [Oligoflexia bacterium]